MDINNLEINQWKLDYITSKNNIAFVLKMKNEELQKFIEDDSSEFFISITDDDHLQFSIHIFNVLEGAIISMDIQPYYRESKEIVEDLKKLLKQNTVDFFVSDNSKTYHKVLKIFDNDKIYIKKWLGEDVVINTSSLKDNFKAIPINYMIPQRTDTAFWFICKVSNKTYNDIKSIQNKIQFEAIVAEDILVLYLYIKNPFATIYFSKDNDSDFVLINNRVREDFKVFLKFNKITFLINNEDCEDKDIIDVHLDIDNKSKKIIRDYMEIV